MPATATVTTGLAGRLIAALPVVGMDRSYKKRAQRGLARRNLSTQNQHTRADYRHRDQARAGFRTTGCGLMPFARPKARYSSLVVHPGPETPLTRHPPRASCWIPGDRCASQVCPAARWLPCQS